MTGTPSEPLSIFRAATNVVTILLNLHVLRILVAARSLLACCKALRDLFGRDHILSNVWQQVSLAIVLAGSTMNFHIKLTAFQLLRMYWVLALRNIILVM